MTLSESRSTNPTEKELIGRVAATLVKPGDTLMMDGGFTTYQVACQIKAGDISVVTNSLDVAQVLARRADVKLVLLGGDVDAATGTVLGPMAEANVRRFWADKAILGADALRPDVGLTSPNPMTAQTKRVMVECAREVIVVADYSKLCRSALHRVAPTDAITTLVTDDQAEEAVLDEFRAAGVEVIVASRDGIVVNDEHA